jgi:hypothetical protein
MELIVHKSVKKGGFGRRIFLISRFIFVLRRRKLIASKNLRLCAGSVPAR